ncbi:hypothetical protein, partial [Bacillus sp. GbtcB15]|uniref:hypothetical protein n=1 Tax=Bacillus sp. GbtcB15 TaxID=2824760 RepID=UPI001C309B33
SAVTADFPHSAYISQRLVVNPWTIRYSNFFTCRITFNKKKHKDYDIIQKGVTQKVIPFAC